MQRVANQTRELNRGIKRLNQHPPSNKCPSPLQGQNNFAQLLANVQDTPDKRVRKTLTMTEKNKENNYKNKRKKRKKQENKKREKQQEEGKMSGKCILNQ